MRKLTIVILGLSMLAMGRPHDFYVSITEINVSNDTLQVAIKLFTHDFEEVLKETRGESIFLDHSTDMDKAFKAVRDYCDPHFTVSGAGKPWKLTWIGHEYVEDVTWVYAYAIKDKDAKILFVKNTLLSGHFHDQHNMVHFKNGDETQSKLCTKSEPEVRFTIKGN